MAMIAASGLALCVSAARAAEVDENNPYKLTEAPKEASDVIALRKAAKAAPSSPRSAKFRSKASRTGS
jgi:hypothetical protein